ncbi:MAG TPA: glycosyltransferase family 2 protein [Persephonella sp.]|nr:glycosyltransferase family 2 protein [Persephonella sp.]
MHEKLPVSVVIATYNSELFLEECLKSVSWASEIIIVDMYSSDRTIEIAKKHTDKVFKFKGKIGFPEPAYRFGLEKVANEWVFIFASDEIVPYSLSLKIGDIIYKDIVDVVYIPRKNFFFGEQLKGGGWGPLQDMHPRLFKRGAVSINETIHRSFNVSKNVKELFLKDEDLAIIHFNYIDIDHFIDKLNKYTTIEAINMIEGSKKPFNSLSIIKAILKEFMSRFILRKGYKDGWIGLGLSILMVTYQISSFLKLQLMKKYNDYEPRNKIIMEYKKKAAQIVEDSLIKEEG